jgi:hypothetical protein
VVVRVVFEVGGELVGVAFKVDGRLRLSVVAEPVRP